MSCVPGADDESSPPVWSEPVLGAKYVRLLARQLESLREEAHGNRKLFLDDVFVVSLMAFFNPAVRSLRLFEDFSQAPRVQQQLSIPRVCRSTLSDFHQLADPTRLEPLIQALRSQLRAKFGPASGSNAYETQLQRLLAETIAVDGTFLPALAQTTWAVCNSNNHGVKKHRARLDVHLAVQSGLPEAIVVPQPAQSEPDAAIAQLQPGKLYLYDRGYTSFELLAAHASIELASPRWQSSFVIRYRLAGSNTPHLQEAAERELTGEDCAAGVISDRVGVFDSKSARQAGLCRLPVREVIIAYQQEGTAKTLRLITNLLDVPAAHIGVLYRMRWQVELFFRWFKVLANFNHLISGSREAVQMHMYVAIIAILLMYLHTGYRPSKYLFALLGLVAQGESIEAIMPILRERERQCERDRQSAARRDAKKRPS